MLNELVGFTKDITYRIAGVGLRCLGYPLYLWQARHILFVVVVVNRDVEQSSCGEVESMLRVQPLGFSLKTEFAAKMATSVDCPIHKATQELQEACVTVNFTSMALACRNCAIRNQHQSGRENRRFQTVGRSAIKRNLNLGVPDQKTNTHRNFGPPLGGPVVFDNHYYTGPNRGTNFRPTVTFTPFANAPPPVNTNRTFEPPYGQPVGFFNNHYTGPNRGTGFVPTVNFTPFADARPAVNIFRTFVSGATNSPDGLI
ncbi:hypothetical protein HYFRA_00005141 [Hymenoscyphus fraxineus]|uniref:Uncharacterized protein n=1 Tax=Hymenoscyphus fraxineus TaxID=746836 RepID=A0A9N9LCS6_9HELO|nr:hypothetical protein HYFRA_00005141 [Hymenoscyphus fraxineus]